RVRPDDAEDREDPLQLTRRRGQPYAQHQSATTDIRRQHHVWIGERHNAAAVGLKREELECCPGAAANEIASAVGVGERASRGNRLRMNREHPRPGYGDSVTIRGLRNVWNLQV